MHRKHKGSLAELQACAWLLREGYEVFRNVSQHGIADLIAWRPGQIPAMIDVTSVEVRVAKDGTTCGVYAKKRTNRPDVKLLYADTATGKCGFDLAILATSVGYTLRPKIQREWRGCSVAGCDRKHDAKGLCKMHYNQEFSNPKLREKHRQQKQF